MKKLITLLLLSFSFFQVWATHQRAGEITYKYLGGLTYEFTILTYTFLPSPADRPSLTLSWGDGSSSDLPRIEKINMGNDIQRNLYTGQHTYNGIGQYIISLEDPNRNYGILNIPNSVNIPLYIETMLTISPFFVPDNSPQLLLPPIDMGCTNAPYIHNPGAYDIDGDSLSYKLVTCRGAGGLPIAGYVLPNQVGSNVGGTITLDPLTGTFTWNSPKMQGEYNIAILIEEWRQGVRIGYVTRDMQIIIEACDNLPPHFGKVPDTCVIAGGTVMFDVSASDPNGDDVTLTGTGGPLVVTDHPATFTQPITGHGSVTSPFVWHTVCNHVRKAPYQVYFKAIDNGFPVNLVNVATSNITVIAPAPKNLTATPSGNSIHLNWLQDTCTNAIGYKIYRRNGFFGYMPGYCQTGVPAYTGYIKIATVAGIAATTFIDDNNGAGLTRGTDYCYMVIAYFADNAESIASEEVCATLKKDIPIITNVSISTTDNVNGAVFLRWLQPSELDTIQTPGPYKYYIFRSINSTGPPYALIDSLPGLADTTYVDTLLNTKDKMVEYLIGLENETPGNRFYVGSSDRATSVFLNISPTDHKLILSWTYTVPWVNDTFTIYRQNPSTTLFDSIGFTTTHIFADSNLVNGVSYCFKVRSSGKYTAQGIPAPLLNFSQVKCAIPVDNVPPCPPHLNVKVSCEDKVNKLVWNNPNNSCATDVLKYNIYYTAVEGTEYALIATNYGASDTTYLHSDLLSIAGCYVVTAVDSNNNESIYSNDTCVDIDACPVYSLPNVFTPNGDGHNDLFKPFPYTSVEKVNMTIFNRWGVTVFTTHDPDINWDGKDKNSHVDSSEGVYFYVCEVFERRLKGLTKRTLSGVIHLLR